MFNFCLFLLLLKDMPIIIFLYTRVFAIMRALTEFQSFLSCKNMSHIVIDTERSPKLTSFSYLIQLVS